MKKAVLISALLFCFIALTDAQDYKNAIGGRLGPSNGLTFKHFFKKSDAFEGIFSFRYRGINLTGLYERHQRAFDTDGLYFFYGAGGHLGFYNNNVWFNDDRTDVTVIGIDGIIGLEYVFNEVPFNIGLDWKPALNFAGYSGFWSDEIALSIRYTF